jgi:hypothetical protein
VSTGSLADSFPGALGQLNTHVLLGADNQFGYGASSGSRFGFGYWFDHQGSIGIEGVGLILEQGSAHQLFAANGSGAPLLGVPFFNSALGREDFAAVAIPLKATGYADVASTTHLYGGEVNIIANLYRDDCWSLDLLGGFRYLGLSEGVIVSDATTPAPGFAVFFRGLSFPAPASTAVADKFDTFNHFTGGQLGGRFEFKYGHSFLDVAGRVALGNVHEIIHVNGYSALSVLPGGSAFRTGGGLLAGPSNAGGQSDDDFAVVPEVDVKLGYEVNCHLSFYVGYTFLYVSSVVRPGSQIDHNVNPFNVPTFADFGKGSGPPAPLPHFDTADYWAHGVSFGVEIKF